MNTKPLIVDKLADVVREFPDYTFGQIIYSVLKELPAIQSDGDTKVFKRSTVFEVSDKELYSAINRVLINEKSE